MVLSTPSIYDLAMATGCSLAADDAFGPVVDETCRGGFDFTLSFEQYILGILPAVVFGLSFAWRLVRLMGTTTKTLSSSARLQKLVLALVFVALQLSLFALWCVNTHFRTKASLPFAIINLVVAFELLVLSWVEDTKSIRPSSLISVYLLFTTLLDIAQSRTLWLRHGGTAITICFTASVATKAILLITESQSKRLRLTPSYKDIPPETTSGIINRSFLWWVNDLFRTGLRSLLTSDDMTELDKDLATAGLSLRIIEEWLNRKRPERRYEFPLAAFRALWQPFLLAAFPRLCLIGFTFSQPFLISRTLTLLAEPENTSTDNSGHGLIGAAALIYFGLAISNLHYNQSLYRFITMFRGSVIALIYDHLLALPVGAYEESAATTLMSTDVDRIVLCLIDLNECWARLIEVALGILLLALQLRLVCVVPIAVVIISFFGSAQISRTIGSRQKTWVDAVQKRIIITASVLSEMRSIKMMGLSRLFTSLIQDQRVQETYRMAGFRWSIVWQNIVQNLPWAFAPPLTFVIYVAQAVARGDPSLGATQAFTSLSIITLLTNPAAKLLSAIPSTAASVGCFDRIQQFLVTKPREDPRTIASSQNQRLGTAIPKSLSVNIETIALSQPVQFENTHLTAIAVEKLTLRPAHLADVILSNASFTIEIGSLTIISGPVGSGKTTLLKAMLGEVIGESSDDESGFVWTTSGRMAFCSQTPWLPSATIRQSIQGPQESGATVDEDWYQKCLHACDLERDIAMLHSGDLTRIGSANTVLSGGQKLRITLARAIYARPDIILVDDVFSGLDPKTQATLVLRLFGEAGLLKRLKTTVVFVTHANEILPYADKVLLVSDGQVQEKPASDLAALKVMTEAQKPEAVLFANTESSQEINNAKETSAKVSKANEIDDLNRATGDLAVYSYYFRCVGWTKAIVFIGFVLGNVFSASFSQVWLKWWVDIGGGHVALYMPVYIGLSAVSSITQGGYVWAILILISPFTARAFHYVLLTSVMRAPLAFFSSTDSGSLLNRFSQDMTLIEGQLATGVLITVTNLFSSLASAALVTTGSAYMAATLPVLIFVVWGLQHVYLRTSRQLRLLDIEARSPLFTHFLETCGGLLTIRAFRWERQFIAHSHRLLDYSQRPYYLLYCVQRWLNLVLDLIVGAEAVLVIGLAVGLRHSTSPGQLGVSLNNILSFSTALSSLISGWTLLETSLGSIARLKSFEETVQAEDQDKNLGSPTPPPTWPDHGMIEYRGVTASHTPTAIGIHNVNLEVKPRQKIGVCGRTGSGKSSLMGTLLRLLEIDEGHVYIDGVDISTLPRELLRERLLVLPQDPMVIPGTFRLNVDPHVRSADDVIRSALERVNLWGHVHSVGLDAPITAASLSRGQQQLLALARVIHKKRVDGGQILLLDEATSNVDEATDKVVQRLVREEFVDCTTMIVAHRVNTVLDCDVIVVMDKGKVVEMEAADGLLHKNGGWFARLARPGSEEVY